MGGFDLELNDEDYEFLKQKLFLNHTPTLNNSDDDEEEFIPNTPASTMTRTPPPTLLQVPETPLCSMQSARPPSFTKGGSSSIPSRRLGVNRSRGLKRVIDFGTSAIEDNCDGVETQGPKNNFPDQEPEIGDEML